MKVEAVQINVKKIKFVIGDVVHDYGTHKTFVAR